MVDSTLQDVFSKFTFYIKEVSHSSTPLLAELYKLNTYLLESPHRFLTRDIPDHLDCMMLPKLQHIRVAAKVHTFLSGFTPFCHREQKRFQVSAQF